MEGQKKHNSFVTKVLDWIRKKPEIVCQPDIQASIRKARAASREAGERVDRMMDHIAIDGEDHWFRKPEGGNK